MKEFVCIVCPNGCNLKIDEKTLKVTGNKCSRGEKFAIDEITHPMRTICTTIKTAFDCAPVLPCRVSAEIPKERIFEVMDIINKTTIAKPVSRGDVLIKNVLNLGVDIIATSSLLKNNLENKT